MNKDNIIMYNMLKKDESINALIEMQSNNYDFKTEINQNNNVSTKSKAKKLTKCYTRGKLNK